MVKPVCKNCGEELWPQSHFETDGMNFYATAKCENCDTRFELQFELVEVLQDG